MKHVLPICIIAFMLGCETHAVVVESTKTPATFLSESGEPLLVSPISRIKTVVLPEHAARLNLYKPKCLLYGNCGNTDWPVGLEAPASLFKLPDDRIFGLQNIPQEAPLHILPADLTAGVPETSTTMNVIQFLNGLPAVAYDSTTDTLLLARRENDHLVALVFQAKQIRDRVFELTPTEPTPERISREILSQIDHIITIWPTLRSSSRPKATVPDVKSAVDYADEHPYDPASGVGIRLLSSPEFSYYPEEINAELKIFGTVTQAQPSSLTLSLGSKEMTLLFNPLSTIYFSDGAGTFKEQQETLNLDRKWRLIGERQVASAFVDENGRLNLVTLYHP